MLESPFSRWNSSITNYIKKDDLIDKEGNADKSF